ncbi:Hypothetical protein FKW44_018801 [Caligus rogercresseyi]|uniref:Uncharacterized protein n=1 Tax=Caligus rogercresseyi TaxID=217165 RepID=A0A7T8JX26_CALRO|nr:Hypothetical protein FKW44_018801 [Caligus rogercresseyi]
MTSKEIFKLSFLASLLERSLRLNCSFTLHPWITLLKCVQVLQTGPSRSPGTKNVSESSSEKE